jgi:hypothetical protein
VLYAPELGLTLVSISKITAAGFARLFWDEFCRIFDKRKILGIINKQNGTYHVNHTPSANTRTFAASTIKTVSIDELHLWIGHIAPEATKCLVKDGLVTGIKLDDSTEIRSCDPCKYVKMTRKPVAKMCKEGCAAGMGDIIHSDVWGPSPTKTIN